MFLRLSLVVVATLSFACGSSSNTRPDGGGVVAWVNQIDPSQPSY